MIALKQKGSINRSQKLNQSSVVEKEEWSLNKFQLSFSPGLQYSLVL